MVWVAIILCIYLLALFVIAWVSLHPFRTPVFFSPGALECPQEDVLLSVEGNSLTSWWVEAEHAKTVVIFGHGYMMNRSEMGAEAVWLYRRGISSFLIDFRAHGRSGGKKSGLGYHEREDLKAAIDWVRNRCPGTKVILFGDSMGAAASALAAAEVSVDGLILDSCYSRLPDAVLGWWRFLGGNALMWVLSPTAWAAAPLAGFNPWKVDIGAALTKSTAPLLVLHGDQDRLALPTGAERNAQMSGGPSRIVWFEGCNHSEGRWIRPEQYHQAIEEFLIENEFLSKI